MSVVARAVEEMLLAGLLSDKLLLSRKSKAEAALMALCALLAAAGLYFLVLSLYRHLEGIYPPDLAALAAGAVMFAAAFIAALTTAALRRSRRSRVGTVRSEMHHNITALVTELFQEFEGPVMENPKTAMMVALISGYFMADHHARR